MHDDVLERRLRAALRSAGDGVALTITASELERRWIVRRRRSLTTGLLLVAAVGIGLVGVLGVGGGWFDGVRLPAVPAPSETSDRPSAVPSSSDAGRALPDLADLIADHARDRVVLAHANGPALGSTVPPVSAHLHSPMVDLGPLPAPGDYEMTIACRTDGFVGLAFGPPERQPLEDGHFVCDASVWTVILHASKPASLQLATMASSSWRVVVRRMDSPVVLAAGAPALPVRDPGEELLVRAEGPGLQGSPSGAAGPILAGDLPQREGYLVRLSCTGRPFVEYLVVDDSAGSMSVLTETLVACDGSIRRDLIAISEPAGATIHVTAPPGARWQLLVTAPPPPAPPPSETPGAS